MRTNISETIFFIERGSGMGLQAQLRETVVSAVLEGRVPPGARLPSTRRAVQKHERVGSCQSSRFARKRFCSTGGIRKPQFDVTLAS